ncbi:TPA: hypothetical protein ACTW34_000669 [Raoultella planticola]
MKSFIYQTGRPQTDDADFMEFIDKRGGFWEMEVDSSCIDIIRTPDKIADRVISEFHRDYYLIKDLKLSYGFLQNESPNAAAISFKNIKLDFVGINAGLYTTLYLIFTTLLSRSDFLPHVGHPHKENSSRVSDIVIPKKVTDANQGIFIPRCEIRSAYATVLTGLAFEFILSHECSHLLNGHLDFVNNMRNNYLAEDRYLSKDKKIIHQTIEMDADSCATSFMVNKLLVLIDRYKSPDFKENDTLHPALKEACKLAYTDETSSMISLNLAIDTINKLMDEVSGAEWTLENQFFWSHPMPAVRRYFNHVQIWSALNVRDLPDELKNTITLESFKNMMYLNLAWDNVKGDIPTEHSIDIYNKIFNNPDVHKYYAMLRETWKEIRPELLPLKRGRFLAE